MQALVRRIVSNIAVRVHSLIVKYVHDDIVLSLNVKRLSIDSVGIDWEPSFAGMYFIFEVLYTQFSMISNCSYLYSNYSKMLVCVY